jgi:cysteine rich repeat protein
VAAAGPIGKPLGIPGHALAKRVLGATGEFMQTGNGAVFAALAAFGLLLAVQPVQAQQPTPEQIAAIKQSCRSDFMANCEGVQPGGKEALECLKRNVARLSGGCKAAVSAVGPPPAAAHPAPAAGHPVPAPPAAAPAASAVAPLHMRPFIIPQRRIVILAICHADVARLCSNVPPGRERILECLAAQAAGLSPECYRAVARVSRR